MTPVLSGLVTYYAGQCQYRTATDIAVRLLGRAERSDDAGARKWSPIARRDYACTGLAIPRRSLEHFDRVLALYDPDRDRQLATLLGFDARIQAAFLSCFDLMVLGHLDQALRRFELASSHSGTLITYTAWRSPTAMAGCSASL